MARIAGVNLPLNKRSEIGLTYIYGIGRSTSNKVLAQVGVDPDTYIRDLTEDEVAKLRDAIDDGLTVEGDLRRERSRTSSACRRSAPTAACATVAGCRCAGRRRRPTRAPARAPSACRWRARSGPVRSNASSSQTRPRPAQAEKEHPDRPGAHQDLVQQHDRLADGHERQRDRVGVRRRRRLQGLAQVDPVRRAGDRRRRRPQGPRAGAAEGRGLRQGPGLRARDGDPLAAGRRPGGHGRQGRHAAGTQRCRPRKRRRV